MFCCRQQKIQKMCQFFSSFMFQAFQNSVSCLLIRISFFYITFANFWYITCSVPNFIPIWSWVYGLTWKTEYSKSNNIQWYIDDNKSRYSRNTKGIFKSAKKIYEKLYTKQTSTTATTEFLSKIPNRKKISNELFNLSETEKSLDVS